MKVCIHRGPRCLTKEENHNLTCKLSKQFYWLFMFSVQYSLFSKFFFCFFFSFFKHHPGTEAAEISCERPSIKIICRHLGWNIMKLVFERVWRRSMSGSYFMLDWHEGINFVANINTPIKEHVFVHGKLHHQRYKLNISRIINVHFAIYFKFHCNMIQLE